MSQIVQDIVNVTPQQAKIWLDLSEGANFRAINFSSKQRIARLAEVIKNGGWRVDGNPLKFNSEGKLVDGQHRLLAIYESGITCTCTRVTGIDDYSTIDTGKSRSLGDWLRYKGEGNYFQLGSMLGAIWRYKRNPASIAGANASNKASNQELFDLLDNDPAIKESLNFVNKAWELYSISYLGAVHYIAKSYNKDLADEFITKLASGANLEDTNPILHLRNKLLQERSAKKKTSRLEMMALIIKAWNYWAQNKPIKSLRFITSGSRPEEFPTIYVG